MHDIFMSSYSTYTEDFLLDLLQNGDSTAFTILYNRYWDRLLYVAGIKLRDLSIAEELVQDVFTDIWNRRESLQITGSLNNYLAAAMKHRVINAQAKIRRNEQYIQYAETQKTDADNSTEQLLNFAEAKERLSSLVADLPEKCRITYLLSREQGLSHKEIAAKLQITEKAVERNLTRALKVLRAGFTRFLFSIFTIF